MNRVACQNCFVPTPRDALHRGHCSDCIQEADSLPPNLAWLVEEGAVNDCRQAGLNAHARPCADPQCGTCVMARKAAAPPSMIRYSGPRRYSEEFTDRDAYDLDAFFRVDTTPKWERSTFGAMCERVASSAIANPEHKAEFEKRTTPVSPPRGSKPVRYYDTEVNGRIVQVAVYPAQQAPESWPSEVVRSHGSSVGGGGKDPSYDEWDLASYFDRQYRMKLVFAALSRLSRTDYQILEARYSPTEKELASSQFGLLGGVALLTERLEDVRKKRSRDGQSENSRDTLGALLKEAKSSTITADARRNAGEHIEVIGREAREMVGMAEAAYGAAAMRDG